MVADYVEWPGGIDLSHEPCVPSTMGTKVAPECKQAFVELNLSMISIPS